jgi:hypothetical protein
VGMSGLVARSPFGAGGGGGRCGRDARGSLGVEGRGAVGALASWSAGEPQMSVDSLLPLGPRAGTGAAGVGAIGAALAFGSSFETGPRLGRLLGRLLLRGARDSVDGGFADGLGSEFSRGGASDFCGSAGGFFWKIREKTLIDIPPSYAFGARHRRVYQMAFLDRGRSGSRCNAERVVGRTTWSYIVRDRSRVSLSARTGRSSDHALLLPHERALDRVVTVIELRSPIAQERIEPTPSGLVRIALKRRRVHYPHIYDSFGVKCCRAASSSRICGSRLSRNAGGNRASSTIAAAGSMSRER